MARPCRIFSRTRSDVYATLIECIECIAPSAVMHAGRVHTSAVCLQDTASIGLSTVPDMPTFHGM